jgi:hypothetical protein
MIFKTISFLLIPAPDENEEIEALAKKSSSFLATQRYFTKTFKPSKGKNV